jgi:hypothetical protein
MDDMNQYGFCHEMHAPPAAKLLYCYLLALAGGKYHSTALPVRKLASALGLSRSATRNNLHRLERLDRLGIMPRYSEDGGRISNQYTVK